MPISNKCTITVKQNGKQYNGQMINISAGGFAFSVRDNFFSSAIGSDITLSIPDLPVENARQLEVISSEAQTMRTSLSSAAVCQRIIQRSNSMYKTITRVSKSHMS